MARIVHGPYVSVEVFNSQTNTPLRGVAVTISSTVYTDPEQTTGVTSLTTDSGGAIRFYAAPGTYTFTAAAPASPIEAVEVLGEELGTRAGGGGIAGAALTTTGPGGTFLANTGTTVTVADPTSGTGFLLWGGTLNGNCTITLTAPSKACEFRLRVVQDSTGSRTVTIASSATINYPAGSWALHTAAGSVDEAVVSSPDGTSWEVYPITDGTITSKGDLLVGSGAGAVSRQAAGSDGQSIVYDSTQTNGVKADWRVPAQENVNTVGTSGATQTIPDPVTAQSISRITLTANCTFTFPTAAAGKSFTLVLVQDGTGSRTATWPGTVKWASGSAPTLTSTAAKVDAFGFLCADGTNWLGFVAGQNF